MQKVWAHKVHHMSRHLCTKRPKWTIHFKVQDPGHQMWGHRWSHAMCTPSWMHHRCRGSTLEPPSSQPSPTRCPLVHLDAPQKWSMPTFQNTSHEKLMEIAKQSNLADLKHHSLWIGGTIFYLLKGVPFDVVKVIRWWAGEAFMLYLGDHGLILTSFLQADQQVFNRFMWIAMPLVS